MWKAPFVCLAFAAGAGLAFSAPTANLPPFELENWDGRTISRDSLQGNTTIVVPTFAKCLFACPMITFLLTELDKEMGAPSGIQYLHVSVNPVEDTAEEISSHFEKHDIDARRDPRWLFVNGPEEGIRALLDDMGIEVTRTPVEGGFVIEHTIRVFVVGPGGDTVASFDTYFWDAKEMLHAVRNALEGAVKP